MPTQLVPWHQYLSTQASTSAAIAGLLFVALSMNVSRIIKTPGLSSQAAIALAMLLGSVIEALLGLWPQGTHAAGLEIAVASGCTTLVVTISAIDGIAKPEHTARISYVDAVLAEAVTLPSLAGGILLASGTANGMYVVALSMVLSVAAAFRYSWLLSVAILR